MMPAVQVRLRQALCRTCPTPCDAFTAGVIVWDDPSVQCPLAPPRWEPCRDRARMGLGDAVATVAQPIARALDARLGTDIAHCAGCGQRQADWNAAVPDIRHPFRRKSDS